MLSGVPIGFRSDEVEKVLVEKDLVHLRWLQIIDIRREGCVVMDSLTRRAIDLAEILLVYTFPES